MQISPNASPEEQRRLNEYWANLRNKIRNKKKPMQASPSAQQALPSQQDLFNQFNQQRNAFSTRINSDPFFQRINQQQQQLNLSLQQKQQGYVNSLNNFLILPHQN